jgi:hypothetical protein
MTANEERMRDVKTTALEVMLRSRIVATASSNFVSRIVRGAVGMKQIKGARLTRQTPQSSRTCLHGKKPQRSIQRLKDKSDS